MTKKHKAFIIPRTCCPPNYSSIILLQQYKYPLHHIGTTCSSSHPTHNTSRLAFPVARSPTRTLSVSPALGCLPGCNSQHLHLHTNRALTHICQLESQLNSHTDTTLLSHHAFPSSLFNILFHARTICSTRTSN